MKSVLQTFPNSEDILSGAQFTDRYVLVANGLSLTPMSAARRVLERTPRWVDGVRDLVVRPFRLKTGAEIASAPEARIGMFPLVSRSPGAVVLGLDDRHLDFRILVEVKDLGMGRQEIAASTTVKTHNLLGRIYLATIMPFHKIIVPAMLAQVLAK
jgi:hypothetical protein